jgi:hypothetical protein
MRRLFFLISVLFPVLSCAQAPQQSPQPFIRAKFEPSNNVIVGQPLRLVVEILVPNYFAGAPDFPPFELDGAIVTLSDDRPEHLNEQINGVPFAGIRRFYLIYPEQPGKFTIPAVTISVPYAFRPPETTNAILALASLSFTAALPPGADDLDYFLPTSELTLRQEWSALPNHLHVGDAVSRTIVVTAQKMQAMLIPPMRFLAPDGVRIYPKDPKVENKKSPIGEFLAGVRTERVSYLFTKPGDYTLPTMEITWWDLNTQKVKVSKLKAINIHVDAADSYVSELPPQLSPPKDASSQSLHSYVPIALKSACALLILAVLSFLLYRIGPPLRHTIQNTRKHWRNSERAHFARLKKALRSNDATRSYALLLAWVHRAYGETSLHTFLQVAADPHLDRQILALSRAIYRSPQSPMAWEGGEPLTSLLSRHRRNFRATQASRPASSLPPLNPI